MKLVKFLFRKQIKWGILKKDRLQVLQNCPYTNIVKTSQLIYLNKVKLLAPADPSKIILVGLNYKDHAQELKMKVPQEPIIFLKPPTTLLNPNENIIYPKEVKQLDFEAELAIVIKSKARNIAQNKTKNSILGFTCLNDVTARDIQKKDGQWTRAKSFDSFCPVGPWLETDLNPDKLKINTYLNGKIKQDSHTGNFIFPVSYLVSFVSKIMTLNPGDIISTGTPAGIGPMKPGDKIQIEIENIGILTNFIKN
ncbi:MAG: fumarylacetoacetate hydrolase family protein [Candidatus Omnitrophota bacterium]